MRDRVPYRGQDRRPGRSIHRFRSAAAFASYTGPAPIEASSGDVIRHRLSRAGDRQLNCCLHTMAITQISRDTPGRAYYRRKREAGKSHRKALRCLKEGCPMSSTGSFSVMRQRRWRQIREDSRGRLSFLRGRLTPRIPALRIGNFPDHHRQLYNPNTPVPT